MGNAQTKTASDFFRRYRDILEALPVFLLTLGCGIDSGTLMTLSAVIYFADCKLYGEKPFTGILKSRAFLLSAGSILLWFLCVLIPMYWTGGKYSTLAKYAQRILPLLLLCLYGKKKAYSWEALWLGSVLSLAWYGVDTAMHPIFKGHRLHGSFHSPNGLANTMCLLLPMVSAGLVRFGKQYKKTGAAALLLSVMAIIIILLTGSRNGYITCSSGMLCLFLFLFFAHDKFFVKIGSAVLIIGLAAGLVCAPPKMVRQRMEMNLGKDGRVYLFQVAADIYRKHPNTGIGLGNWNKEYRAHYEKPGREKNMDSPHNIFLQTLDESGRIGLFGFLLMFAAQFYLLIKSGFIEEKNGRKELRWTVCAFLGLLATVVSGMMDYDFFGRHGMHFFFFYCGLGLCAVYWHEQKKLES